MKFSTPPSDELRAFIESVRKLEDQYLALKLKGIPEEFLPLTSRFACERHFLITTWDCYES